MDMKTDNWSGKATRPVGLIIRQKDPNNLEMPFDQLEDFITPSELFYIRSHFSTPELDPLAYRLSISGAVRNELSLSYADIRAMPSRTCVATLECAGNSRVFMVPPVPGAQWAKPPGPISYARSIPRTKAMESNVLIAYQMNGRDLTPDHGYPLRAIVPGHYGMASVKWLTDIVATTQPFQGYWQTSDYGYWDDSEGTPVRRPLAEMKLKSQIARPRVYEMLEPNRPYTIFGAAWAGDTEVTEILISLDAGGSWVKGDFVDPISRHAWRRWKYDWITPAQPGRYTLLARARGVNQRAQPDGHNPNFGSYVIDHPLPIEVFVAAL